MQKKFKSVTEMVRETSGSKALTEEFEKTIAAKTLVRKLFTLRQIKGLSQQEVAKKIGCSQGRVSKLEAANDADLRLGDVVDFLTALDLELGLVVAPRQANAAARVKHHALAIKRITDQLAELAADDKAIAKGVANFFGEAAFNLIGILQDAAKKLPLLPEESPFRIEIEVIGDDTPETAKQEQPATKKRKKALA